ncbi:MAG: type II toxin-antitoxin system prevent-host-death family antitoxin [Desulfovibrio sp.]|jgi:DNA-binding XRE family transcriptional regulator|nr:type II toxin-antitoxin system prevent-host-death family antitoxin [Desulfovibrio sp.]
MNAHIDHQIIKQNGKPVFVVIPYDDYVDIMEGTGSRPDEEVTLPHEVVKLSTLGGLSLVRAWREHLGLTQGEVARRMGISQPAYARIENKDTQPRIATCKRLAEALGIAWDQLTD